MAPHLFESVETYFKKNLPVDAHEISPDVHLQNICLSGVVTGNRTDMMFQTLYSMMGSPFLDATVAVCDEGPLEKFMCVVIVKMMHYAVPEIRRKYLPDLRVFDDETCTGAWSIFPRQEFVPKRYKFLFKVAVEFKYIRFSPFVSSGILVCLV